MSIPQSPSRMLPECHPEENRKPNLFASRRPDPARPPCGGWHASPRTENTPRSRFAFLPRLDQSLVRQQMSRNSLITLGQPLTPRKGSTSTSASKDPPVAQRVLLNFRRHYTIPPAVAQGGKFKNLKYPQTTNHEPRTTMHVSGEATMPWQAAMHTP